MAKKNDGPEQPVTGDEQVAAAPPAKAAGAPAKKGAAKTPSDTPEIRALQIRFNFYKWFLGTFLIGAFTTVTTFILKEYEFKLKTRQAESTYLKPYLDNYMKLFGKNLLGYDRAADMAKFLSCSVVDKDYKQGWNDLFEYCQKRTTELKAKNDSITRDSIENSKKIMILNTQAQKINAATGNPSPKAEAQLRHIQDSLTSLRKEQASLVAEKTGNLNKIDPQLTNQAVTAQGTHVVPNPVPPITAPATDNYVSISDTSKFISKNYAQTFGKVFQIGVNSVSPGKETCNITLYSLENGKFKVFKDDVDLDLLSQTSYYSPDRQYRFDVQVVKMYSYRLRNYATFHVIVSKKAS
ncbi:hypothetical protein LX99_04534 [Mucilaginibacter oryzae]|uniref:Uncharacterized protein n=1 Tax=Mucilaginibacter oryzae TaxID=468058 RepID=A0A316GZM0_9SPHI|nr:hypothetical protein [Mucilaginibacter oryzae]PWK70827.1 hypothetical protein LX99_04534 [Mucilaginibacter oryzae]